MTKEKSLIERFCLPTGTPLKRAPKWEPAKIGRYHMYESGRDTHCDHDVKYNLIEEADMNQQINDLPENITLQMHLFAKRCICNVMFSGRSLM